MKIIYKTGDLLDAQERFVANQVNCQGKYASGIAKQIRERFPKAYADYRDAHRNGKCVLGNTIWSDCGEKTIIHIVGQMFYGNDGKRYTSYDALREGLKQIDMVCYETQKEENFGNDLGFIDTVAFPYLLGCGLGGGDWNVVSQIIEEESICFQPVVYRLP